MSDCNCSKSSDSSGFVSGLTIGLVLGAAGAHYLQNTEKGKELLENLKDKAGEAMESVRDNPALAEKIADLQKTMDAARAVVNSAASRVADATTSPSSPSKSAPKKSFFQRHGLSLGK